MQGEEALRAWRIGVAFLLGFAALFLALFAEEPYPLNMAVLVVFAIVMFAYGLVLLHGASVAKEP